MLLHLKPIFFVDIGQYSHAPLLHTHAQWPCQSVLLSLIAQGKKKQGDTNPKRPLGHANTNILPQRHLMSALITSDGGPQRPIRAEACAARSCRIWQSLVSPSPM